MGADHAADAERLPCFIFVLERLPGRSAGFGRTSTFSTFALSPSDSSISDSNDGGAVRTRSLGPERLVGDLEICLILQWRHPQDIAVVAKAFLRFAVLGSLEPKLDRQPSKSCIVRSYSSRVSGGSASGKFFASEAPAAFLIQHAQREVRDSLQQAAATSRRMSPILSRSRTSRQ